MCVECNIDTVLKIYICMIYVTKKTQICITDWKGNFLISCQIHLSPCHSIVGVKSYARFCETSGVPTSIPVESEWWHLGAFSVTNKLGCPIEVNAQR